jgi:hypothetical protein
MFSKDTKMSKQGTAGKRNHTSLTTPQKLDIRRLESGSSGIEMMALYNIGSSIMIIYVIKWKCEGPY